MIEKIIISRDVVSRYSWLNSTDIDVSFANNATVRNPLFMRTVKALVASGVKKFSPNDVKVILSNNTLLIKSNSLLKDELVELVIKICNWIALNNLLHPNPANETFVFYSDNKEIIVKFLEELERHLSEKNYQYFCQHLDGMN